MVFIGVCFIAVGVAMMKGPSYGTITLGIGFLLIGGIKCMINHLDGKK